MTAQININLIFDNGSVPQTQIPVGFRNPTSQVFTGVIFVFDPSSGVEGILRLSGLAGTPFPVTVDINFGSASPVPFVVPNLSFDGFGITYEVIITTPGSGEGLIKFFIS